MTCSLRGGAAGRCLAGSGCIPWTSDRSAAGPQASRFAFGRFILPSAAWPVVQVLNAFNCIGLSRVRNESAEGIPYFTVFFL